MPFRVVGGALGGIGALWWDEGGEGPAKGIIFDAGVLAGVVAKTVGCSCLGQIGVHCGEASVGARRSLGVGDGVVDANDRLGCRRWGASGCRGEGA
eukprot:2733969-Alexandrium_andersonii.AAC.1